MVAPICFIGAGVINWCYKYVKERIEKRRMLTKKTLYLTDLDGTLLNTEDRISQDSLSILNDLIEQGMQFTYATARSLVSAREVTEGLSVSFPVIVHNGTFIMNPENGKILYACSFSEEERNYVRNVLQEYENHPLVYAFIDGEQKVSWHKDYVNEGMKRYLMKRQGDPRLNPLDEKEMLYQGEIFYYTCIGTKEELQPIYDCMKDDERFTCTLQQELYRPEYWCEIMPQKATKANAMKKLKEMLQCERVVCFGDAINDRPMFMEADESYAVANAVPELKQIATGILASNQENGVANWLKENIV